MQSIQSIPNAERTIEALRSLGYNLNSSIADIVDNAVTEKVSAKNVIISLNINPKGKINCIIQDDGFGMNNKGLKNAMRFGTEAIYEEGDLGKFGMGMKTASLSHCNTLTVLSKKKNLPIASYRWDMKHIKRTQEWELLMLNESEIGRFINELGVNINHGTIVHWDDMYILDKEYKSYPNSKLAQNFIFRLTEQLRLHLRMVFHRFLDGSLGEEKIINIFLNGKKLIPWDPFCRQEENTIKVPLTQGQSELQLSILDSPIKIAGYILPNKEGFSTEEAWKEAKGLLSWNDSQGYYIYRENRLIRFGGWHSTKAKDEHDKLARISIDIDSSLDSFFRITVNKAKVQFPEVLFHHLKNEINPLVIKKAKAKYNKSEDKVKIKNNFRRNKDEIKKITKRLLNDNKITTGNGNETGSDSVKVHNPAGIWLSNKVHEFLQYGSEKDYEIISDHLNGGQLWKIICNHGDKFKVIINSSHPFYTKFYKSTTNKAVSDALDAIIFSLAFAELYNKNDQNAQLFDSYKAVCSKVLDKLTKEEIF